MNFNKHYDLANNHSRHAFLSPSKPAWVNYDEEKLKQSYASSVAAEKGTKLHHLAKACIELGVKLPQNKRALNSFVNDAIGFRMVPEQILFYSYCAFGTADAISFRNNLLRIHDLKTGTGRVTMLQLEVYAALFCHEYEFKPNKIDMELRIYQSGQVTVYKPEHQEIKRIMEKIVLFDKRIQEFDQEELVWIEKLHS
jgi:hypothetical protein